MAIVDLAEYMTEFTEPVYGRVSESIAIKRVRRKAADLIEEHGWIQGEYGNEETGYCLFGAVSTASEQHVGSPDYFNSAKDLGTRVFDQLVDQLEASLGSEAASKGSIRWNDSAETKKDDVLMLLRSGAGVSTVSSRRR